MTLIFVVMTVFVQTIVALALAVLFTRKGWGMSSWRTLFFLPITIPTAVSAMVCGTAFRGDRIINGFLLRIGLDAQPFLASSFQVLWSITILASWIGVGYWIVFLIAGLKDIPDEVKEAASLDGAGALRTLFSITLPLLRRPLAFIVVANTLTMPKGALQELTIGRTDSLSIDVGPVISEGAKGEIDAHIEKMKALGCTVEQLPPQC